MPRQSDFYIDPANYYRQVRARAYNQYQPKGFRCLTCHSRSRSPVCYNPACADSVHIDIDTSVGPNGQPVFITEGYESKG